MLVQPTRRFPLSDPDSRELRVLPSRIEDGLFFECAAVHPTSAAGRKVTLHVPADMADDMLHALRRYAIERRRV